MSGATMTPPLAWNERPIRSD